nr:hypothetical protein [Nonomuraea diastatica]
MRAQGFPVTDETCARLSPIPYEPIDFLGRYAFTRADVGSPLRPFHDMPARPGELAVSGGGQQQNFR